MNEKHEKWIENYVSRQPSRFVRGKCDEATAEMRAAFPELRRVAGLAYWVAPHGKSIIDQHWWLVDEQGAIVDPTVEQFGGAAVTYEPIDLSDPAQAAKVPNGKCMECGGYVFGARTTFCSGACEDRYIREEGHV